MKTPPPYPPPPPASFDARHLFKGRKQPSDNSHCTLSLFSCLSPVTPLPSSPRRSFPNRDHLSFDLTRTPGAVSRFPLDKGRQSRFHRHLFPYTRHHSQSRAPDSRRCFSSVFLSPTLDTMERGVFSKLPISFSPLEGSSANPPLYLGPPLAITKRNTFVFDFFFCQRSLLTARPSVVTLSFLAHPFWRLSAQGIRGQNGLFRPSFFLSRSCPPPQPHFALFSSVPSLPRLSRANWQVRSTAIRLFLSVCLFHCPVVAKARPFNSPFSTVKCVVQDSPIFVFFFPSVLLSCCCP